jgi:hypothetical protein
MKLHTTLRLLGSTALLVGLIGVPSYGQQSTSQDPAAQSQPSAQPQTSMSQQSSQSQPSQIFVGKIAKSKSGDVVFKDDAGTSYKLDNADQATQYVGKTVKMTGTLDASTNTIHVTNIEGPSS